MTLRFLLVCEGSSDAALIHHINGLILQSGHSDPQGQPWWRPSPLVEKIRNGLEFSGDCDLLLVHRDADASQETGSAGPETRRAEIEEAVKDSGFTGTWVAVVPVRMTESWLLLDESAIRRVAGKANGNVSLGLPGQMQVESESDPKGCLARALLAASETSGRRRQKFNRDIPQMKRLLLEELPVGGPLEHIPSWVRFRNHLLAALVPAHPPTGL